MILPSFTNDSLLFTATNQNNADVTVSDVFVDVLSYEPYDSYQLIIARQVLGSSCPIYEYRCKITTERKRYTSEFVPYGADERPFQTQYVKIDGYGGSESFNLEIFSDTPGIYTINIELRYIIKNNVLSVNVGDGHIIVQVPYHNDQNPNS